MRALRDNPFPFETARDLLGILRAMYAATKQQGGNERRLELIAGLGSELHKACAMARQYSPGSLGFTSAWERAERAVRRLGALVDCTTPLEPTLRVAGERVAKAGPVRSEQELKRRGARHRH